MRYQNRILIENMKHVTRSNKCGNLKTCGIKKQQSFVARPRVPNAKVVSRKGIAVQTIHVHPVISRYG